MAGTHFKALLWLWCMQARRLRMCVLLFVCVSYLERSTVLRPVPVLRCSALCTHTGLHPQQMHGRSPKMQWQNSWYKDMLGLINGAHFTHSISLSGTHTLGIVFTTSQPLFMNLTQSRGWMRIDALLIFQDDTIKYVMFTKLMKAFLQIKIKQPISTNA